MPPLLAELLARSGSSSSQRAVRDLRVDRLLLEVKQPPVICKVAGTNGKGSVSAMLEACLIGAGKRVGLFTSPHLYSITERFRLDGVPLSGEQLDHFARRLQPIFFMPDLPRPSFFEMMLMLALESFTELGAEVVILEAGVGGSNDAVSRVRGKVSAITSVGLDHTDRLGPTLSAIATDKAGIVEDSGTLVLANALPEDARRAILAEVSGRGCRIEEAEPVHLISDHGFEGFDARFTCLPELRVHCPLPGNHQLANLGTLGGILRCLKQQRVIENVSCLTALRNTRWSCRHESLHAANSWILDVAHNDQALAALADALDLYGPPKIQRLLVFGHAADRTFNPAILKLLAERAVLVGGFYRSAELSELRRQVERVLHVEAVYETPEDAVRELEMKASSRLHIGTGSVFLAGALRHLLTD